MVSVSLSYESVQYLILNMYIWSSLIIIIIISIIIGWLQHTWSFLYLFLVPTCVVDRKSFVTLVLEPYIQFLKMKNENTAHAFDEAVFRASSRNPSPRVTKP